MKIASIRKFEFNTSEGNEDLVILYNSNEVGDTSTPETYLLVNGLAEGDQISAVGYMLEEEDGVPMKFADISGIGVAEVIEADGIYLVLSSALERLELHSSGNCKITVKQVV